ncbi:MAG: tail fiber domain-containing protein [Flavobacteriales bacterium]|nr:tail fiber domain-containing protein [Flavobacteriales bacterium]
MKTFKLFRPLMLALALSAASIGQAQVSNPTNNSGVLDYVGCDNTSPFPLRIMQNDNQPIDWYTNAIKRMGLNPSTTYGNLGPFTNIPADGFLGICPTNNLWSNGSPGPWARLHLHDPDHGTFHIYNGYRPWMVNGTLITGHGDQMYVGHKYGGTTDPSDAIFCWSDNDGVSQGPDHMRFIFTDNYTGAATGEHSLEGQEIMRLHPQGWVGMGDYFAVGVEPTERVDLLDGRLRIRQLPDDPEDMQSKRVLVVDHDDPLSPEYGVVKWRDIGSIVGQGDCDWEVTGTGNVVTCFDPAPPVGCPSLANNVAIGTTSPTARLHIIDNVLGPLANEDVGVRIRVSTSASSLYGAYSVAGGPSSFAVGVEGRGSQADRSYGVRGFGENSEYKIGVYGEANLSNPGAACSEFAAGVYGQSFPVSSCPGGSFTGGWAAWFNGLGFITAPFWVYSDPLLKDNIQPMADCLDIVSQLAPKTYNFRTIDYAGIGLPDGLQAGLLSPDVEQVLPHLVREVRQPAVLDSLGNEITPSMELKAMNYEGLIPYLIGAIQEQQAQIQQMQQDLAYCCTNPDGTLDGRSMQQEGTGNGSNLELGKSKSDDRLSIVPNPFQERTTLSYLLDALVRVRLQVHTESGMHLATLRDQPQEPGSYSMTWDTQDLAPGLYYVTLFADGKPVVKKAVKVR